MAILWARIFDTFGSKRVTRTDVTKGAFVPNKAQVAAIAAAGITPSPPNIRPAMEFQIKLLYDSRESIGASYYNSIRATDPTRLPEARMGHAFISSGWLSEGDEVVIGNIGNELFALKAPSATLAEDQVNMRIATVANAMTIMARAKMAKGKPARKDVIRSDFVRNAYVVMAAILRSNWKCETPGCKNDLFLRDDNKPYLEVHHIYPLGEGGDDTYENVAALCPHCHRELHFGKARAKRQADLAAHVSKLK